jgi:hypothetical protein
MASLFLTFVFLTVCGRLFAVTNLLSPLQLSNGVDSNMEPLPADSATHRNLPKKEIGNIRKLNPQFSEVWHTAMRTIHGEYQSSPSNSSFPIATCRRKIDEITSLHSAAG